MRTVVHLSDLHFGRVDPALLDPLVAAVTAARPDVVAVSGDLTQRARRAQFREARAFLARLPTPQIVVPGNHDVPLYDVIRRFVAPLARFRRYITDDPAPFHCDDEIAVVGINTARSLTFKDGRINQEQIALIAERLQGLAPSVVRIVVTHHPFDLPAHSADERVVGRSAMAMRAFAESGVDLLLSGHLHSSHSDSSALRYKIDGYAALVVQAGTATSTRGRGENNAFNIIRIARPQVTVEAWSWQPQRGVFALERSEGFRRGDGGWARD